MFPKNSARVEKQRKAPLRVIFGNPPYSVGQKSENDNAANQEYKTLDAKIASTYVAKSNSTMNKALYDAYIKAFRWSTDRLDKDNGGIIAFVSNGSWLDGNATSGFRKTIETEFSSIYIFDTRGNARTSGEVRRKEAGNVFGHGSRTPVSITVLVKNPNSKNNKANIKYYDIGDYLKKEEKLTLISSFVSIENIEFKWKNIVPNEEGDWINQRNESFETFFQISSKDNLRETIFNLNSNGVVTNRDAWVYNFSKISAHTNVSKLLAFYSEQLSAYKQEKRKNADLEVKDFIDNDPTKISWTRSLKNALKAGHDRILNPANFVVSLYRPFMASNLYFSNKLNECVYQLPKIFPEANLKNISIVVTGVGANKPFTSIISNLIPNLDLVEKAQCFPLYYYEKKDSYSQSLFDKNSESKYIQRDGISDFILERAIKVYGKSVHKEDIFYYVYGFLHSPEYRRTFKNDLKKMLPRLPLVDKPKDFWSFSKAGRALADLHINYETAPAFPDVKIMGNNSGFYSVEKMRFPKKDQKHTIIYNSKIIIENIPDKAYEYVVNGKSAIEWIMERYQVKTDKKSGIKNDPNDWSNEVGNERYILDLLLSIINVSVQSVDIVNGLPKMKFE